MNRKGFTLIELLAVLVALGLVLGIGAVSISGIVKQSKVRSEEAFTETIKDAMDVYLSGKEKNELSFGTSKNCNFKRYKKDNNGKILKDEYEIINGSYSRADINFEQVINSTYKPINKNQLVNPANNKKCVSAGGLSAISIQVYRTDTSSYYYKIDKKQSGFNACFENFTVVDKNGNEIDANYISNLESPETFVCS